MHTADPCRSSETRALLLLLFLLLLLLLLLLFVFGGETMPYTCVCIGVWYEVMRVMVFVAILTN